MVVEGRVVAVSECRLVRVTDRSKAAAASQGVANCVEAIWFCDYLLPHKAGCRDVIGGELEAIPLLY